MTTPRALALTAAIFLLLPTGLLAGWLAHVMWTNDWPYNRGQSVWPIALFAVSATSLACCARTRDKGLAVVCLLVSGGAFVGLLFVAAAAGAS